MELFDRRTTFIYPPFKKSWRQKRISNPPFKKSFKDASQDFMGGKI
jgi:hypothetical protein